MKMDTEAHQAAQDKLKSELIELVGKQPKGLTEEELDQCWQVAKDYWGMVRNVLH
jgi:hypothetical protein